MPSLGTGGGNACETDGELLALMQFQERRSTCGLAAMPCDMTAQACVFMARKFTLHVGMPAAAFDLNCG